MTVPVHQSSWRDKYADGKKGVCDFSMNYDFYFKWLLNKVISCFCVHGLPDTVNETYLKAHLILDGHICYTDFDPGHFVCIGGWGGVPDEYYIPTTFIIANPVLGSKIVYLKESDEHSKNGVLITNTAIDGVGIGLFSAGLYDLIHQTATLLADNIISINCCQINSRVTSFFTADSEAKASAGEAILKKMYAGAPYQILRQDLVEKLQINPISQSYTAQTITELVELHNYIVSNFFQAIGIRANSIMKRERLITDEIDSQNDFVQLSILEILASWQRGFDEVNELYGTEITVELNPVLIREISEDFIQEKPADGEPDPEAEADAAADPGSEPAEDQTGENAAAEPDTAAEPEPEPEKEPAEPEEPESIIEEEEEVVEEIVDIINDTETESEEDPEEPAAEGGDDPDDSDDNEEEKADSD